MSGSIECRFKPEGCNKADCIGGSLYQKPGLPMPLPCEMRAIVDAGLVILGRLTEAQIRDQALQDGMDVQLYLNAVNESIKIKTIMIEHGRLAALAYIQDQNRKKANTN